MKSHCVYGSDDCNKCKPMNTKEQDWEKEFLTKYAKYLPTVVVNVGGDTDEMDIVDHILDFIRETREQAKKEERERIKDKIGNIFNCLSDIDEYTDKMAIERMFKIWESL